MASLYAPVLTNQDLINQISSRHRKINLDYLYISQFPYENQNLLQNINWKDINFNTNEVNQLNEVKGIYMFCINPYLFSMANHSNGEIILYIGQANNLRERLNKYFYYPNSNKASDQQRRYMTLFFSSFLKVKIYETGDINQNDLDLIEYSLIDSILPPFNLKFKTQLAQNYRRIIYQN